MGKREHYPSSMPRAPRLDAPGVLHHIMGRGIEKKKIFLTDEDRLDFLARLEELVRRQALKIYAWALLPNHFHLLCKTQDYPLSSSMRKLLTGYAVNFNKRHNRSGHLFQNRYKSIICQEDRYLKELVRYIHLNPLRANVVKDLTELNRFPWSGHGSLLGRRKRNWQDTDYVLSFFGQGEKGIQNYLNFIREGLPIRKRPELVSGGLRRSTALGSTVAALKGRKEKPTTDERILGDEDFVASVLSRMDTFDRQTLRLPQEGRDLALWVKEACSFYQVTPEELKSGSRRTPVAQARSDLARIGVRLLGYSGAELARLLGVTTSCITRAASTSNDMSDLRKRYPLLNNLI